MSYRVINKIIIPPIKCQGIKTKLINHINENIEWNDNGCWIEPFLGSGVVLFNICPPKAIVSDTNNHIIDFYKAIQSNTITPQITRDFLEVNGEKLKQLGEDYYYEKRQEFNKTKDSLLFLFLNRSCFNGMMRFNNKGEFNVPFCRKPQRFDKTYITKICNQVKNIQECMKDKDWTFLCQDYKDTINKANPNDFIYLDPPYIGRDTNYFSKWEEKDAIELTNILQDEKQNLNFAMSMWKENAYRKNSYIYNYWNNYEMRDLPHFYFVGGKESNRNSVIETLILSKKNVDQE